MNSFQGILFLTSFLKRSRIGLSLCRVARVLSSPCTQSCSLIGNAKNSPNRSKVAAARRVSELTVYLTLDFLEKSYFDVIITDLRMPNLDGTNHTKRAAIADDKMSFGLSPQRTSN